MEENKNNGRDEIFSEKVKAGKRTYFFDVKSTRANDFYVTITESKKRFNKDNEGFTYEKHKIFLYKEDFNKFMDALNNTINHVKNESGCLGRRVYFPRVWLSSTAMSVQKSMPYGEILFHSYQTRSIDFDISPPWKFRPQGLENNLGVYELW